MVLSVGAGWYQTRYTPYSLKTFVFKHLCFLMCWLQVYKGMIVLFWWATWTNSNTYREPLPPHQQIPPLQRWCAYRLGALEGVANSRLPEPGERCMKYDIKDWQCMEEYLGCEIQKSLKTHHLTNHSKHVFFLSEALQRIWKEWACNRCHTISTEL